MTVRPAVLRTKARDAMVVEFANMALTDLGLPPTARRDGFAVWVAETDPAVAFRAMWIAALRVYGPDVEMVCLAHYGDGYEGCDLITAGQAAAGVTSCGGQLSPDGA